MQTITLVNLPAEGACVNSEYTVSVDCGPDDIVDWFTVQAPGGVGTGNDAIFSNPNGATTNVILTAQGTYYLYARCLVPN